MKQWYEDLFLYSKYRIDPSVSLDYDKYWEEKRRFWDEKGETSGVLTSWQKDRANIVLGALPETGSFELGDIGCGEASILKYIMDRKNVTKATGYDSSSFILEKAAKIGIHGIKADLNKEEDLEKIVQADYQLLLEVLEHFPHSERILAKAYATANKGVFFSFPNTGYFIFRLRLLFGKFPKQWKNFPNEHLRFWTYADLKWWLRALGYENYEVFHYKGIPLLNKIWPSLFGAAFVVFLKK